MRGLNPLIATFAAVAIVIAAGFFLIRPSSVGGPPTGTEAPTPGATATPFVPTPEVVTTSTHATPFAVPFSMTWPATLAEASVGPDVVEIHARNGTGFNLFLISKVGKDPCTTDDLLPNAITTPQQFMDWLGTISHATARPVTQTTIGGQPALERELDVGSLTGCIDTAELHSNIHSAFDTVPGGFFMNENEPERWVAFQAGGKLIAFAVWPLTDTEFVAEADQAISTITFTP